MRRPYFAVLLTLLILGGSVWLLRPAKTAEAPGQSLTVYCAAGLSKPVERIARQYQAEFGVSVNLQFGGTGTLLNNLQVAKEGDLFIAADGMSIEAAQKKDLIAEITPLVTQRPVLVVAPGNPLNIRGIADLLREDVKTVIANPEAAAVGRVVRDMLTESGQWSALEAAVTARGVFKPTVNDVATDVKLGAMDAGIVWDFTAAQFPELTAIALPGADAHTEQASVAVLRYTARPTAALHLMRFIAASDRGLKIFAEEHFTTVQGDPWAERPEVLYYSGGVNRTAIENTLKAFSEREGVEITTVYNGCGILVGQIKAGERPDVYHTCDASFMAGVEELFGQVDPISKTDLVLLVQKGNPKGIAQLADLGRPGLQVGVCTEDLSTLGTLTAKLLRAQGLYDAVQPNVIVTNPQGDMLVSQLVVGKLDAAVVYRANTMHVQDKTEVIAIPLPGALAQQTYAVSKQARYPRLVERLHAALRAVESRQTYEAGGFTYLEAARP
jgi:molybdate transport system substrate-binding protein